jgi:protein TonB
MKTITADLNEIVFEGREQSYGAYTHRTEYNNHLTRALLISLLLFLSITALPKIIEWMQPAEPYVKPVEYEMVNVDIALPDPPALEDAPEPPALPPPKVPPMKTVAFNVPDPKPDVRDDVTIRDIDSLMDTPIGPKDVDGDTLPTYNWDDIDKKGIGDAFTEKKDDKPEVGPNDFVMLEKEPAPVNMDDIKKMIGYPPMAKEAEIEGKVVLRVQVDTHGDYVRHVVIKDPHPILTAEVVKQLKHLKFTPGIQSGKPIKVWVTIPFDFKLLR